MGFAKLSIWIRDEQGKVCLNNGVDKRWDWVKIWYQQDYDNTEAQNSYIPGSEIATVYLPKGLAHVEKEIAPGAYIIRGHFCEHDQKTNDFTDRAFVIAKCGEEICVNLIVPNFVSCVHDTVNPLINAATLMGIKEDHIKLTIATLLAAAKISKVTMVNDIEARRVGANEIKATEMVKVYDKTLKILKDLPEIHKLST